MEFKHIYYFIKLSECSSFSEASNKLYISQQALSKSIKNLEMELNVRLFHRTNQGITLTSDGHYLKEQFQDICFNYDAAVRSSFEHFKMHKGKVEFGVCPGFFRSIPIDYLIDFSKQYPHLKLKQLENPDIECENYVLSDKQHFALSTRPFYRKGLQFYPLHKEQLFFIANKEHPLAKNQTITLDALKNENFLFFDDRYNIYYQTLNECQKQQFTPNIIYKSSDVSQLIKLVIQNKGILICVKHVYMESSHKDLVCIPIAGENMVWELGLIFQKYEYLDQNSKFFIEHFIPKFLNVSNKTL